MAAMTMSAKYDHYAPRVERSAGPRAVVGRTVALPARAGRDRSPVRLTRRGRRLARVMVIVVALVVTLMLMVVGHVGSSQADVGPVVVATSTVVVQPGQTLWAIALEVAPDADARDTIERIQVLSGLSGVNANVVHPGQRLVVPRRG